MKISSGSAILGNEHQAAGFAVEASDHGHLTPVGDFEGEQLSELMPQRHGSVRLSRMDEQMSGFIEDQEARVLEENAAAERFGDWWLACHEHLDKLDTGKLQARRMGEIRKVKSMKPGHTIAAEIGIWKGESSPGGKLT
jgi:hypothetical protein